jgi:hypothetical protein
VKPDLFPKVRHQSKTSLRSEVIFVGKRGEVTSDSDQVTGCRVPFTKMGFLRLATIRATLNKSQWRI